MVVPNKNLSKTFVEFCLKFIQKVKGTRIAKTIMKKEKKRKESVALLCIYSNQDYGGDFPGGPVAKTLSSQCKGPGFDSLSGN